MHDSTPPPSTHYQLRSTTASTSELCTADNPSAANVTPVITMPMSYNEEEENTEEEDDNDVVDEEVVRERRSNAEILEDDVLRKYHKVKFADLVIRERSRRKLSLVKQVLAICID
jgi:hypothetical protein